MSSPSPHPELTEDELLRHVRSHENAHVQRYVDLLVRERRDLAAALENVRRVGITQDARAHLARLARYAFIIAAIIAAFALGRSW